MILGVELHAQEEAVPPQAHSTQQEELWGLLSLAELHVVMRGGEPAPLTLPPCQCHTILWWGSFWPNESRVRPTLSGQVVAMGLLVRVQPTAGWEQDLLLI